MYPIYFPKHPSLFMFKKKYKTKDLSIKMLHVINNPLATSDGFTGYSVGFGIRCERKQQGRGYEVPDQSTVQGVSDGPGGAGGDTGGGAPS